MAQKRGRPYYLSVGFYFLKSKTLRSVSASTISLGYAFCTKLLYVLKCAKGLFVHISVVECCHVYRIAWPLQQVHTNTPYEVVWPLFGVGSFVWAEFRGTAFGPLKFR